MQDIGRSSLRTLARKNGLRVSKQQQQIKNNVNDEKKITKLKKTPLDIVTSSFP